MSDLNLQVSNPGIGAMSAYAYFVQIIREEHKKKHPGEQIVFSEFSKKCAEKWKTMTPKERKRFEEMAIADKERFNNQNITNYTPPDSGRKRRKRRHKDPNQPKRAWSAFFFFCDEHRPKVRAEHPDWRVGQVAKTLGTLWEECKDKTQYEAMSQKDKERYEQEMNQFRAGTYVPTPKAPRTYNGASQDNGEEEDEEVESKGEAPENGSIPPPSMDTMTPATEIQPAAAPEATASHNGEASQVKHEGEGAVDSAVAAEPCAQHEEPKAEPVEKSEGVDVQPESQPDKEIPVAPEAVIPEAAPLTDDNQPAAETEPVESAEPVAATADQ